jgi:hypothetical protein
MQSMQMISKEYFVMHRFVEQYHTFFITDHPPLSTLVVPISIPPTIMTPPENIISPWNLSDCMSLIAPSIGRPVSAL